MLLRPDGLQGPLIGSACCSAAEDIKIAVVNKDLEELAVEALPMVLDLFDHVVAVVELEADWPFFRFLTSTALHPDLHTLLPRPARTKLALARP
jgi:hypothetical protein